MAKRALITGITGQDGSYLAELLLSKGYEVHGMVRRSSEEKFERIAHLRDRIRLHQGDLLDQFSIAAILADVKPDEVYNLAAWVNAIAGQGRRRTALELFACPEALHLVAKKLGV